MECFLRKYNAVQYIQYADRVETSSNIFCGGGGGYKATLLNHNAFHMCIRHF